MRVEGKRGIGQGVQAGNRTLQMRSESSEGAFDRRRTVASKPLDKEAKPMMDNDDEVRKSV